MVTVRRIEIPGYGIPGQAPGEGSLERQFIDKHLTKGLAQVILSAKLGRGGSVVIRGTFGSGRSTLLADVAELARQVGFQWAVGFCHFAEIGTRLGLVSQLTEDLFGEPAVENADEASSYRRLRQLAAERPLILCVDDLQWIDMPSLHWLCYMARRIHDLAVLVVVTIRDGEPVPDLAVSDLEDSRACRAVVRLGPLDAQGVATAVRRCYPDADDIFCAACERLTAGNPWLLSHLLRVLADGRAGADQRPDVAAVERVTSGGYAVIARLNSDLERLCRDGARLARAVAALDAEATPDVVSAVTGIPRERCDDIVRALVAAGFVREGSPARFVHPLVCSSILSEQSATSRAELSSAAADYLYRKGAPAERIAAQLERTSPGSHPWAADILAEAARAAVVQRGSAAAVLITRRVLQENLSAETAAEMLIHLGQGYLSSDLPAACAAYKSAAALSGDAGQRATAMLEQAAALLYLNRIEDAVGLLEDVLASAVTRHAAIRARAMRALALSLRVATMCDVPKVLAELRCDCAGEQPPEDMLAGGMVGLDWTVADGETAIMAARPGSDHLGLIVWGVALMRSGKTTLVAEWCGREARDAAARGDFLHEALARLSRARAYLALGRLECAHRDAALARQYLARAGAAPESAPSRLALVCQLDALLNTGALTEAADLLTACSATGPLSDGWADSLLLGVRGTVQIKLGNCDTGLRDLRECEERLRSHPIGFGTETSRLSEAALVEYSLGHTCHAHDLAVSALTAAEAMGDERCIGMALHALGVTLANESRIRLLTRSADVLACTSAWLAAAAAKIELGSALRRANRLRQSRHLLREGHAVASGCGARDLASRAADELVAARGRLRQSPAGPELLTGSEERIAALVCDGLSNGEIAGHLFVARRTVETHLTRIYRKLGISGRAELASALGEAKERSPAM